MTLILPPIPNLLQTFPDTATVYNTTIGSQVTMVCKSAPASPTDEAVLLLWYKGDSAYPIHGVDRRENSEGTVASASRGTDPRYSVRDDHHLTALTIHKIRKEDEGQYRCRIDYRVGSTTNKFMKLIVTGRLFSNTLGVIILFSLFYPNRNILQIFHGFQLHF